MTYPEIALDKNGYIYVIWDKGRYAEHEIRYSRFTEADLEAGVMLDENDKNSVLISRTNSSYRDIVSTNPQFDRIKYYELGTEKSDIIKELPTTINLTFEDGVELEITGKWKVSNYNKDILGTYRFYFVNDSLLPLKYSDARDLLSCYVILEEKKEEPENPENPGGKDDDKKGCKSSLSTSLSALSISFLIPLFALKKKKENE